jgi:hypothetical protein
MREHVGPSQGARLLMIDVVVEKKEEAGWGRRSTGETLSKT